MPHSIILIGEPSPRAVASLVCRAADLPCVDCSVGTLDASFPLLYDFTRRARHAAVYPTQIDAVRYVPESLLRQDERPQIVLLSGHSMARAFGYTQQEYFQPRDRLDGIESAQVFVVPHHGARHFWEMPRRRAQARAFLEGMVREVEAVEMAL